MLVIIIAGLVVLAPILCLVCMLVSLMTDDQLLFCSNRRSSRREMQDKVYSKEVWKQDKTTSRDVELTFESFKCFVDLNPEGWSWQYNYAGIYECNPCFQPPRTGHYLIRFKTYKDYVKAAAYWHGLGEMKSKRKQELAEAKNTAEFLAIQKQRAKEAEVQAEHQMRESEEQIMEILEQLKSESTSLDVQNL